MLQLHSQPTHKANDSESIDDCDSSEASVKAITISLSEDIYSMTVLLLNKDKFQSIPRMNKILILFFVLFAAFIQLSCVIILMVTAAETFFFTTDETEVHFEDSNGGWIPLNDHHVVIMVEYKGIPEADSSFSHLDYVIRLAANGILFSYLSQSISSITDYAVIVQTEKTFRKRFPMFLLIAFQSIITTMVSILSAALTSNETDVIAIISSGVGLVILLEVDDYLFKALESLQSQFDKDLFQFKLNPKNTIYQKYEPLTVKLLIIFCFVMSWSLICVWHLIYITKGIGGLEGDSLMYIVDVVIVIVFISPIILIHLFPCKKT